MNRSLTIIIRPIVLVLSLFITTLCFAYHGGGGYHGEHYHGGDHYYHGGGYYHGHGDYYHGGWGGGSGWNPGVVIQVPLGVGGYYFAPSCQTVRTCNRYGHCWLQQSCY